MGNPDNWLRLPFFSSPQFEQTGGFGAASASAYPYAGDLLTLTVNYTVGNCVTYSTISNCAMSFALVAAEANTSDSAAAPAWAVAVGAYRTVATLGSTNQPAEFSELRTFELPISSSAAGLYVAFRAQSVPSHSPFKVSLHSIDLFQSFLMFQAYEYITINRKSTSINTYLS